MDYLSLNGQLLPAEDARISPADAGLLHGAGLFETMRVKNGKIFRLVDHLDRLHISATHLGLSLALSPADLLDLTSDLLDANALTDARLRLTITRGDLHAVTPEQPTPPTTLLLTAAEFTPYPPALYATGMSAIISRYKQNPESPLAGHKTTSYFDRLLALREAQTAGAGEALWFTPQNETLAEGSISNVFIVDHQNTLITPPLAVPLKSSSSTPHPPSLRLCLPGITRKLILQLAIDQNLLPHERAITIDDLLTAKEVFLTNAIMGVMPVTRIERHPIADEKPGDLTQQLRTAYDHTLAAECAP